MTSALDATELAARTWAGLVPAMAGRRPVRVSADGGRTYPRRRERPVTERHPNQPSALMIYTTAGHGSGCAPIFCVDLDSSRGLEHGAEAVDADFRSLRTILSAAGLTWFSDSSPNGGRHVYVPLASPAPFHHARATILALAARLPTVDPQPMLSIASGCIRPPGARHRSGGHQVLDGPLAAAQAVLATPNPYSAWRRLLDQLRVDEPAACTPLPTAPSAAAAFAARVIDGEVDDVDQLTPLPGWTEPDPRYQAIARTGDYDAARYPTASHARQGVIWASVACGWQLRDVARRVEDGTWAGLAALYARYAPRHRRTALVRDWKAAIQFEKQRRDRPGVRSVHVRTTSTHKAHARGAQGPGRVDRAASGVVHREVRVWLAAVDQVMGPSTDLAVRVVLYALAEAAVLTDSLVVEHGNRSLAIATGLDQSSVGRVLKQLLNAPVDAPVDRGLVDLVRPARGVAANAYHLVVPSLLKASCEQKPWRAGRIRALRPAFRELGRAAAFVYDVLERNPDPAGGRDIAQRARLSPAAAYEALALLSASGLATRRITGWVRGPADPAQLAEAWGIVEDVAAQLHRYRLERRAWWAWLGVARLDTLAGYAPTPPPPRWHPPPDVDDGALLCQVARLRPHEDSPSLLELLEHVLGAELVETIPHAS